MSRKRIGNSPFNLWKSTFSRFLILLLDFLFAFNLLFAGNQTSILLKDTQDVSMYSQSLLHTGSFVHSPFVHNKISLVFESISEAEEDIETELDALDFQYTLTYLVLSPGTSFSDKTLSVLPSHFIESKDTIPLFILFHSWKNFLHS